MRIFVPTKYDYNGTDITTQGNAMKDILSKLCTTYSDAPMYTTFSGIFLLGGSWHYEVTMYSASDTVNGIPRYCRGVFHPAFLAFNNEITMFDFGTYNGEWRVLGIPTTGTVANHAKLSSSGNMFLTGGGGTYIGASNFRIYNLTISANSTATVATNHWGAGIYMGMTGNVGGDLRLFTWNNENITYHLNAKGDNTYLTISRNSAGTLSLKQTTNGTQGILIIGNYSFATS